MKRVAIPVNDGKLSEYFGRCSYYKIFEIEGNSIQEKDYKLPVVDNMDELPAWAFKNGITDIIAYKIDRQIIMLFNKYKINLFVGIDMDTPEQLINDFLKERITSNHRIIAEIMDNNYTKA
jgi:predicted Fe-Mo cluster-binding NifX family protein